MNFDDKPVIYIITQETAPFEKIAKAARAIGYDVHFPQIIGVEGALTHNPENIAATLIDLDLEGFNGVGLLKDIQRTFEKENISFAHRSPILAISEDSDLYQQAKDAGAEIFMDKKADAGAIFTALLSLDEESDTLDLTPARRIFPPQDYE